MCGIAGAYGKTVDAALDAMAHRGPDARGMEQVGPYLELGHVRLSIIDLDERSNQPFTYGGTTIVFNGEIWNYRELRGDAEAAGKVFKTESDTEVLACLLDQHGVEGLALVQGMFSVAWSRDGSDCWIARDRFGETPLHFSMYPKFCFASEVKGLLALGIHPANIEWLPPGSVLRVTREQKKLNFLRWYELATCQRFDDPDQAANRVRDLLRWGCEERAISDVPVCTLLSGGIDSAAVAACLKAEAFPDLVAYTAVMDLGSPDLACARETAEMLGIQLQEVFIMPPTAEDLSGIVRLIEMPSKVQVEIGWPCLKLAEAMRSDGFKVTYSGEGSDELWGSYGFAYHGIRSKGWFAYRRELFLGQHRKNFARCNKIFMSRSIECRLPFLSTGLVEYALGLGERAVKDGRHPKAIMSRAFRGMVPERVATREKLAFQDGLGIKRVIAKEIPAPDRYYEAEFTNHFGLYRGH